MLTLTFLGVGAAFSKRQYQSNALLEAWTRGPDQQHAPDDTLWIDFGATAPRALFELMHLDGFRYLERDGAADYHALGRVFITHLHADHIGGLEELAIRTRYARKAADDGQAARPQLLGSREVLHDLWEHSLKGGLGVMRGRRANAEDYFYLAPLPFIDDRRLQPFGLLDRYECTPFATNHIQFARPFDWPSFGLHIQDRRSGKTSVYSGDTRFDPQFIVPLMESADCCFHEVQFTPEPEPVHTLVDQLLELPAHVRSKIVLYHYEDTHSFPRTPAESDAFRGLAQPATRYIIFVDE